MSSNTKKTNFINNQLEYIYFLFRSKTKHIYDFPKPKDSKRIITTSNRKLSSLNKKRKPISLVIAYSYELESNGTAMLELCRCC